MPEDATSKTRPPRMAAASLRPSISVSSTTILASAPLASRAASLDLTANDAGAWHAMARRPGQM